MLNKIRAYWYGVVDGWRQPLGVDVLRVTDHLDEPGQPGSAYAMQEQGLMLGQFLRAGRKSEAYREYGFPLHR